MYITIINTINMSLLVFAMNFPTTSSLVCVSTVNGFETNQTCSSGQYCYSTMNHDTGISDVQGCTTEFMRICIGNITSKCVEQREEDDYKFIGYCCCSEDYCNQKYEFKKNYSLHLPNITQNVTQNESIRTEMPQQSQEIFIYIPVIMFIVCIFVLLLFFLSKFLFHSTNENIDTKIPLIVVSKPPSFLNIEFMKHDGVIGHGKFGAVYKALLNKEKFVAVKKVSIQEKDSWQIEVDVYKCPLMDHENILYFIGSECHDNELWLITQYHENGSLYTYLKDNIVTWEQLCLIAYTMTRGLAHLHEEFPSPNVASYKPSIAHRDFKSSNVLLKNDLSACISDFGLATVFHPSGTCGYGHNQVGTSRYMAPEILEGAINFSKDGFLCIDMYACGLVLWELASRCSLMESIRPYTLPYTEELGEYPSLGEIKEAIVDKRIRPAIMTHWKDHRGFGIFCQTIEECWEHHAETRLSASCVMERIAAL